MKRLTFAFILSLSPAVLAQTLPDEINYPPYQTRYQDLARQTNESQARLSNSQSGLAEARRFISEMNSHIASLESAIYQDRQEISRLQRLIPELERDMSNRQSQRSNLESQIRSQQSQESNLESRYQQVERDLRPLEQNLSREEGRLREMQTDLTREQRELRDAENRLSQAQSQAQRVDQSFENERTEQRKLEQELAQIQSRISQAESELNSLRSERSNIEGSLNQERQKLSALERRVSEYESELAALRSRGAAPEEIAAAERKLNGARSARDGAASEVRSLEQKLSQNSSQQSRVESQLQSLRRDQSTLPTRISQSQERQRQLQAQRAQLQTEIQRAQSAVSQGRSQVSRLESTINQQHQQVRQAEIQVQRQREQSQALRRQIDDVRREISRLSEESRRLSSEIASLSDQIRTHQATIPRLEQEIRSAQSEIAEGERNISRAENDARNFELAIQRETQILADLTRNRDAAQREMDQRVSLYQRYLQEAKQLGANQTGASSGLGEKEGLRLAQVLSKQNGQSVGNELGFAQAKYWGAVRGEIQGYDLGHNEGNTDRPETDRATQIATQKAKADAEVFAQTQYKPVFFEEFVQAAFKRPLAPGFANKMLVSFNETVELEALDEVRGLEPLTPAELARSAALPTPLDTAIESNKLSVKEIESKAQRLGTASVAFVAPTQIPHGQVNCASVYKGLAVFKTACDDSYKATFTATYVSSARSTFSSDYPGFFQDHFEETTIAKREASFAADFDAAHKVGRAEGFRVGKAENYERTYASVYKSVYAAELPLARAKSQKDAERELGTFLAGNALLTLNNSSLKADDFRGGETVEVLGQVKNIGQKQFQGASVIRITGVENAQIVEGQKILNSAVALGLTATPALKVQVLPTARTGQKLVVRGVIELPGDLYKPARQEAFELSQVLSANPANNLELSYDASPSIKGVFNRYIHAMRPKITPTVEDIATGYSISVSAVGENAALVEIRESKFETGAMSANSSKEGKFSYVFKDAAKNKVVTLEVAVTYAGKVIKKELVELRPH